ncbi:hypothetical protein A3844_18855 [Paenibacillus helianthi]|uniref:Uncharacterized protein n=1 Tax=Paenibacillus helianthi TaxID=1349432 RepID=A0ABX3EKA6_9BACL|nr:hypothetical protein [Paenibacillus helianthi]OKP84845.1 hypothetical protein A3844_18855 [Paenibacillus helianthi]
MSHHDHMELETIVRKALGTSRRGMVVADADFTELAGGAFASLVGALSPYYVNGSIEQQAAIHELISKYSHTSGAKVNGETAREMARDLEVFFDTSGIELRSLK